MRHVTLIDVGSAERRGPLDVATPWWPETESIVNAARDRWGIDITVLRLIDAANVRHGGAVTYLVETTGSTATADIDDHPMRLPWARPGGPAGDIEWAQRHLPGTAGSWTAVQVKSWNLSSIWRFDAPDAPSCWLKVVPPFFDHEGRVIEWLGHRGHPTPNLIAHDGPRLLLAHIPGDDGHDAGTDQQRALAAALVRIQVDAADHREELARRGLPDWTADRFTELASRTVSGAGDGLDRADRQQLRGLAASIPARLRRAADAGILDTIQHCDPHPGNARFGATPAELTVLDWGDAVWSCPLLDLVRMPDITADWLRLWTSAIPGSEPRAAWTEIEPIAHLHQAVVYQRFLDNIEPTERRYHHLDVSEALRAALAALGLSSEPPR